MHVRVHLCSTRTHPRTTNSTRGASDPSSDQLARTTDSTGSLSASRPLVSGETLASTASALIITAINLCLRTLILSLNGYQGRDTLEAEQISLYTKLAFAYVANNVVVAAAHAALIAYQTCDAGLALLSVSNCSLVQQSWYERGGVVDSVATLIVTTGLADAISIAFPIDVFFQRMFLRKCLSLSENLARAL